jgi:hypothetical protein
MVDQKCPICYNNHIQSKKESEMSFIAQYRSPSNETSVIKSVPIEYLINARQEVRDAFPGRRIVARFRGPRRDSMALYCTKKNARTFAIYID